ncbi:NADH dehydrogenase 1 alpha subcomplex subunit 1 NDUFA1 [Phycomyces blakesleeanus]|uniref:NADH dehydrogenase [ubiquinone] 1 alpha subcomplex subunit 1 n=2 Tax=Phycomyces blakesleeanus TaxID=4837 RepID=A0A162V4J0_PHYB8|nr:NADH dehydrogenase 1 alpha subcomplex subunit 1 NDUFA1 [Phycomyces blakesleeanus NRRL 1555(-)]OAD79892.1 NADH dehydrogenase 1 alpha subcomplex subunit 1 NDUFA1 [Phycomyces blakesleeanus NRRL 1555(-)]|eukprot:XP_018297932.1 NADH dehydrogenase 1 alpha subcomplex subunit 1 NDUFA1 [Phycomyces blakesleeanus NRRL 1555(-)]
MPVPFESFLPFVIIASFYCVTASGLSVARYYSNDKKPTRYGLDTWERQMMERDRRLTGSKRGQSSEAVAPAIFSTNSVWYLEKTRTH